MGVTRSRSICASALFLVICFCVESEAKRHKVLMVSFDGFRWDFPKIFKTPNYDKLISRGVFAENGIIPAFVTNTFPNHFSLVTGVHPETHGIVDNNMFNSTTNEEFSIKKSKDKKWWQDGVPIWLTAEEQGLRTGVYFWVGSEVEIRGSRPCKFKDYDQSVAYTERVDTVIGWLKKDGIDLALLYFNEPDSMGHQYGIDSSEFKSAVEKIADGTLGYLLEQLDKEQLADEVDLLVVSDHGMTNFDKSIVNLTEYLDPGLLRKVVPSVGTTVGIFPASNVDPKDIIRELESSNATVHMKVYLREEVPEQFHYRRHARIAPLIAIAEEGYLVARNGSNNTIGYHGYSNELQSMRPAFVASGPSFKKNHTVKEFSNLDIYPLLCHLLQIKPNANNGSFDSVKDVLGPSTGTMTTPFALLSVITSILTLIR